MTLLTYLRVHTEHSPGQKKPVFQFSLHPRSNVKAIGRQKQTPGNDAYAAHYAQCSGRGWPRTDVGTRRGTSFLSNDCCCFSGVIQKTPSGKTITSPLQDRDNHARSGQRRVLQKRIRRILFQKNRRIFVLLCICFICEVS